MVNKQKRKGTDWERQLVKLIEKNIDGSQAKRVPGSGAIGTILIEPGLTGDVKAKFKGFPAQFKIEAKVGYGGSKQITLRKEWLDKIKEEASHDYSIPLLACKFSGARKSDGVQYFIAIDFSTFCDIMNIIADLGYD